MREETMALKDILVHLDTTEASRTRLRLVAALAAQHDAHLTALHVVDVALPAMVAGDPSGGAAALGALLDRLREDALADAARVEAEFRELLRREGLAGEWRLIEGMTPHQVALNARYADLVVIGQEDPEGGGIAAGGSSGVIVEQALFASGRPVLIVPYAGRFEAIGRRVLVGWNASREAARAVNDALPLLARAETVAVLAANPEDDPGTHGDLPGADIALHLARHGVTVGATRTVAPDMNAADLLLNQAADMNADLLVVGAYGHSRVRELVLGGVTRSLLRQMTVPVLMSH
jgi:nucleotide-binding universal stress UspA family protein